MKKSKVKKSSPVNPKKSQYSDAQFLKWKLLELHSLGYRLNQCSVAIEDYTDVPRAYPTFDLSLENYGDVCKSYAPNSDWDSSEFIESLELLYSGINYRLANKLNLKSFKEVFDYIDNRIKTINIHKQESIILSYDLCYILSAYGSDYDIMTNDEQYRFMLLEHVLRSKASEALGYWTAKFETMKQNKENVKTKTTKKEANKAKLKAWMKTMTPEDYRLKAQKVFRVTERTVLIWLQEIRAEKKSKNKI